MNVLPKLLLLVMTSLLVAGCASRMIHGTAPTASNSRPQVCTVWKTRSYSFDPNGVETAANIYDTEQSARERREDNAARSAYCK